MDFARLALSLEAFSVAILILLQGTTGIADSQEVPSGDGLTSNPTFNNDESVYSLDVHAEPSVHISRYGFQEVVIKRSDNSNNFLILLHFMDIQIEKDDVIKIRLSNGTTISWHSDNLTFNRTLSGSPKHAGPGNLVVDVIDEVEEVLISIRNDASFLQIEANLYQDIGSWESCPVGLLDCNVGYYETDCTETCRSNKAEFMEYFCKDDYCRCIPSRLSCNSRPNCGWYNFEEGQDLCRPFEVCDCGNIGTTTIIGICGGWLIVVLSSVGFYRCMRNSAGFVAAFDMAVTVALLVTWNFGVEMIPHHVEAVLSPTDIRVSQVGSTGLFGIYLLLALWLFIGTRQGKDAAVVLKFARIYLIVNVVMLVIYQVTIITYVIVNAHSQMYEDGRLWISAVTCTTRLTCIFGVLDYIKIVHQRYSNMT